MKPIHLLLLTAAFFASSCVSTKSTLQNVDDTAPVPKLTAANTFIINQYSSDPKYGYDKDYPINVYYKNAKEETNNAQRFLNALAGPKGESISYKKLESCCPFPTKHTEMGAGFLDVYELSWQGQPSPTKLYINKYEKSILMVPKGLTLKR